MQSPHGLLKLGKTLAGLGAAGSCAALLGFAMIGPSDALDWSASPSKAPSFDYISYFDDGAPDVKGRDSSVRRLGMSAAFESAAADEVALSALSGKAETAQEDSGSPTRQAALDPARDPHLQPENVSVGDRITVVAPDGLSYVYRVTAREPAGESEHLGPLEKAELGQPMPADCDALDSLAAGAFRLVIESVKSEKGRHTPGEQKL